MNLIELFYTIENKMAEGASLKDCLLLFNSYEGTDYKNYVNYTPEKYHRGVVMKTPQLELVVMGWLEGNETGFHGHPGECIFKVLDGNLNEELLTENQPKMSVYNRGDIGYIDNSIGTHKVWTTRKAITLHLYSPPF